MVKHARRGRKRVARRRPARKSYGGKRKGSPSQYATITETVEFKDLTPNTPHNCSFDLSLFLRASAVASNFRWYKAAKVTWNYEPLFNIYQDGFGDTVPYMYTVMNRTQDSRAFTLNDIQSTGARPQKVINKTTLTYRPNWCSAGLTTFTKDPVTQALVAFTSQGLRPNYDYLASPDDQIMVQGDASFIVPIDARYPNVPVNSAMNGVNANQVLYNGHDIWIDQQVSAGVLPVARLTATVTWIFKDPKFLPLPPAVEKTVEKTV